jgi:hypothetical protein
MLNRFTITNYDQSSIMAAITFDGAMPRATIIPWCVEMGRLIQENPSSTPRAIG